MAARSRQQAWGAVTGGPRPSSVLIAGAVLDAVSPLAAPVAGLAAAAWYGWAAGLVLVGLGLLLSGLRPWLRRFALVPAGLYLAQAASLGLALGGVGAAARVYDLLALPKTLALLMLAATAGDQLGRPGRRWLGAAAGAASLKIVLRHLDVLAPGELAVIDPALSIGLGVALVVAAAALRAHETEWAVRRREMTAADLEDFNVPPLPPVG